MHPIFPPQSPGFLKATCFEKLSCGSCTGPGSAPALLYDTMRALRPSAFGLVIPLEALCISRNLRGPYLLEWP